MKIYNRKHYIGYILPNRVLIPTGYLGMNPHLKVLHKFCIIRDVNQYIQELSDSIVV